MTELPVSQYYIKELATAPGYILDEVEYDFVFEIAGNNIPVVEITVNDGKAIFNEIMRGNVKLIKTDKSGNRLSGAVFCLYTADGVLIGEYTTGASGEVSAEGLSYGGYYWQEKTAPNGYVTDRTPRVFNIAQDGDEIVITAINNKAEYPNTGDNGNLVLWLVVAVLALAGIVGGVVAYKKKKAKAKT